MNYYREMYRKIIRQNISEDEFSEIMREREIVAGDDHYSRGYMEGRSEGYDQGFSDAQGVAYLGQ